jgi:hypothetical protein
VTGSSWTASRLNVLGGMLASTQLVAALGFGTSFGNIQLFAGIVLGIIVPRIDSLTLPLSSDARRFIPRRGVPQIVDQNQV